ncbi:CBS domain-containing protein [Haloarchaeobius iranensis]|uniref:CBS domain-containing protein n=1 Tax=Haloarchaeobius iranensis TaxID=996166 RepID=A0A1G9ZS69_9EURY|nr:CBS domain-containing protein [Haloarchaeobius iranensis]SDN23761.1 CBS domain-containing protein [Haloarchaeobius iranensis]
MIEIPVHGALTEDAAVVRPDCSLPAAAEYLRDPDVPALVVRDEQDGVAGVVTESDVVAAVAEEGFTRPVGEVMSTPVVTVGPTMSVGLAADRMRKAGIAVLPIVDDGEYHGVVTRGTLAPYVTRSRLDSTWDAEPLRLDRVSEADAEATDPA